jgi:hypothetical protein
MLRKITYAALIAGALLAPPEAMAGGWHGGGGGWHGGGLARRRLARRLWLARWPGVGRGLLPPLLRRLRLSWRLLALVVRALGLGVLRRTTT